MRSSVRASRQYASLSERRSNRNTGSPCPWSCRNSRKLRTHRSRQYCKQRAWRVSKCAQKKAIRVCLCAKRRRWAAHLSYAIDPASGSQDRTCMSICTVLSSTKCWCRGVPVPAWRSSTVCRRGGTVTRPLRRVLESATNADDGSRMPDRLKSGFSLYCPRGGKGVFAGPTKLNGPFSLETTDPFLN